MEAKKNLNNQQRKMLDEIYTEQFNIKEQAILDGRAVEYEDLKKSILEREANRRSTKAVIQAGKKFFELLEGYKEELDSRGFNIYQNYGVREIALRLNERYSATLNSELVAHQERTQAIRIELAQKKQIIRSAIYGTAISFDEVKAEIEAVLADIKA